MSNSAWSGLIGLVTSARNGLMRKADKAKLDAATSLATPSTIIMRAADGTFGGNGSLLTGIASGVRVIHIDGTSTFYAPAADTDSARGIAVELAKAASVGGDTIRPGVGVHQVTGNLAKNGVHWDIPSGCILSSAVTLFDDGNTAMSFVVSGGGELRQTGLGRLVYVRHPSSTIRIQVSALRTTDVSNSAFIVHQTDGTLYLEAQLFEHAGISAALYWENGPGYIDIDKVSALNATNAVYALCNLGVVPTGQWYIRSQEIIAKQTGFGPAVQFLTTSTGSNVYRCWLECDQIIGPANVVVYVTSQLNSYLIAKKVLGNLNPNGVGGKAYITVQKLAGRFIGGTSTSWTQIGEIEDGGWGAFGSGVVVQGGTHHFWLGTHLQTTTDANAVAVSGGTLNLMSGRIQSPVGRFDFQTFIGATLNVSAAVVYDATKLTNAGTFNRLSVYGVVPGTAGLAALAAATAADLVTALGAIPQSSVTDLTTDLSSKVPTSRTISVTSPITGGGNLASDPTAIGISAASSVNPGSQSSAHYTLVNGATASSTANMLVKRGASSEIAVGDVKATGLSIGTGATPPSLVYIYSSSTDNSLPTLGATYASGFSLIKGSGGAGYGLMMGVRFVTGDSWIQSQRNEPASPVAYNLLLQPSGGNVLIGTATPDGVSKLQVAGPVKCSYLAVNATTDESFVVYSSATYPTIRIGSSSSASVSVTWDSTSNAAYFQTYSNLYPFQFQGSACNFASPATFTGGPTKFPTYTLGTKPTPSSWTDGAIIVTDATPSHALCISNGTSWISLKTNVAVI